MDTPAKSEPAPSKRRHHGVGHRFETRSRWVLFNFLIPFAMVASAVAAVFALGSVQPSERPTADASFAGRMQALMPVRVEQIKSLAAFDEPLQLKVDGTVVPFREVTIATEVAGRILFKSEGCEAGASVKKGDLLVKIDPTDYELEAQRLTRLQEQEYEALGEIDQEMINVKRLIEVAKQDEQLQQREVDRLRTMPGGYASEGEIDKAKRALLQSTQARLGNENQLELLRKRRSRLEAAERLAQAQLAIANQNVKRTEIRSPIDGVIVSEDAELNSFVARGNPIVTIEDTTKVEVATSLRMDQLYWVLDQVDASEREADHGYELPETPAIVEFEISGREGKKYQWDAKLLSYDGIGLDPNTRTVPVRIVVDNPQQFRKANVIKSSDGETTSVTHVHTAGPTTLVRGMFVTVKLLIRPQTPLVVIPAEGLKPGNRVWEFVPDPSVLDLPPIAEETPVNPVKAEGKGERLETDASDREASEKDQERFNPDDWQAGRVVNRNAIYPVDSLSINVALDQRRWWVCEVQDQSMSAGAYVVVSPIGNPDGDSIAARIQREVSIARRSQQVAKSESAEASQ
ncbi:Multidrug resistance protein MdtN [Novipirellula aureliae]|uniref:Multidrug resistance protein MdtN n=1 Tax=Novipirellula aureliae TaxID=2527966 RepID=A0A5C6DK64_9BACT|nr:HlyD family efflux transporter periplasmic adaptor subunit [Novipirellula aureliae]TWU37723.1 Multidrug resistance protein MdtN [Novipirellula aureliae]